MAGVIKPAAVVVTIGMVAVPLTTELVPFTLIVFDVAAVVTVKPVV